MGEIMKIKNLMVIFLFILIITLSNVSAEELAVSSDNLNLDSGCCSAVIQVSDNESVVAFRQDNSISPQTLFVEETTDHNLTILKQHIGSNRNSFTHLIITENGWTLGIGGSTYGGRGRAIENIFFDMVLADTIDENGLKEIQEIMSVFTIGHCIIKTPDGRYGLTFPNSYSMGQLNPGDYLVIPNHASELKAGTFYQYGENPVDAVILLLSIDDDGLHKRNIYSYDSWICEGSNYADFYLTNDDGRFIGLTIAQYTDDVMFNGKLVLKKEIPLTPGKIYVGREVFKTNSNNSFTALNKIINSASNDSIINLTQNYYYDSNIDLTYKEGININKNLTINGNGFEISGRDVARIFKINKNAELKLVNLTLKNGYSENGGAIYSNGNLIIDNCVFSNNTAVNYGGAIYQNGKLVLTISSSKFIDNSAAFGGAVYSAIHGKSTVTNSEFISNAAIKFGGAILADAINCENSHFKFNTASDGAAIYSNDLLYLYNSSLMFNNASNCGGSVMVASLKSVNSYFSSNMAKYGGAVYGMVDANLNIYNSTFTNNEAVEGGSIYTSGLRLNVNDSIFKNNYASLNGGAIYSYDYYHANCKNSSFIQNMALNKGSAIYFATRNGSFDYLTFNNNYGNVVFVNDGYGIVPSSLTISNSYFTKNSNSISYDKANVTLFNNTFSKEDVCALWSSDLVKFYGDSKKYEVILTENGQPLANKKVAITINGVTYYRITDEKGIARLNINLNAGVYKITASYDNLVTENTVDIKPTIIANDIVKIFCNGTQYYATFLDKEGNALNNVDVTFNINGVFYTRTTDNNGVAKLNINLNPNVYILTAYNPVTGESKSNTITVLPIKY